MAKKTKDILKQSLTLGLGLMDATKSKLDKMVKDLNKGISEKDKKHAVDQLVKHVKNARAEAENAFRGQVKKVLNELGKIEKKSKKKTPKRKASKKRSKR